MKLYRARKIAIGILLLCPATVYAIQQNFVALTAYVIILLVAEIFTALLVNHCRKYFPWCITAADETPEITEEGLQKFMPHGFDSELGWVRKPNTGKEEKGKWGTTNYNIDARGSRANPGHENLPTRISIYGDSFGFARQVNDNETWQWHLSEYTNSNVLNFSVGNYGLDQALLRLKREYPKNQTDVVLMAIVPSTIIRILSLWKHYNEFGNTFAFKPAFRLTDNKLELIPNRITSQEKFLNYRDELDFFRANDYFYYKQFKRDMICFPYLISVLANPKRNLQLIGLIFYSKYFEKEDKKQSQVYRTPMKVIMNVNKKMRIRLFKENKYAVHLMTALIEEFLIFSNELSFKPIFLFLPQKDDIEWMRKHGKYYKKFISGIAEMLPVMDFADTLMDRKDLDELYSDDNKYGGHYSKDGNILLAETVHSFLQ